MIQAAKYLGVDPRSLMNDSVYWVHAALVCMQAENELQEKQIKKQQRRQKSARGSTP